MTGAGAAHLAFVKESSFRTEPGTPTYYSPGRNPTVQELTLDNVLERLREPGSVEAVESIAGNIEGAFAVEYVMNDNVHDDVRDIVFNDGSTPSTGFASGLATTSSWYVGTDYVSGGAVSTVERNLEGCIPLDYEIRYQQEQNTVRERITFGYADETRNTSQTPSSITGPTTGDDVPFHGATLTIDSTDRSAKMQSATLRFENISRFQFGAARAPDQAVLAAPETTLEAAIIYEGNDLLEIAYGGTTGNSDPQDTLGSVSGDIAFSDGSNTVATYSFSDLVPRTYEWADLLAPDTDITDPVTYDVNGGISIS